MTVQINYCFINNCYIFDCINNSSLSKPPSVSRPSAMQALDSIHDIYRKLHGDLQKSPPESPSSVGLSSDSDYELGLTAGRVIAGDVIWFVL